MATRDSTDSARAVVEVGTYHLSACVADLTFAVDALDAVIEDPAVPAPARAVVALVKDVCRRYSDSLDVIVGGEDLAPSHGWQMHDDDRKIADELERAPRHKGGAA